MLIIGKEEAIYDAIKVLQGHFQVKDPTSLEDYLGVQIMQSDDGKKAWLGQMIESFASPESHMRWDTSPEYTGGSISVD